MRSGASEDGVAIWLARKVEKASKTSSITPGRGDAGQQKAHACGADRGSGSGRDAGVAAPAALTAAVTHGGGNDCHDDDEDE
ncbi:hypothetical protein ACHMW6_16970 [Pseudoduganella sp. UC29_106]|uniref:hypothetical protein n=1 Tax=Pseudoduganella sp. UC29_106 TaxID=3374553 RepID=UPI0037575D0A